MPQIFSYMGHKFNRRQPGSRSGIPPGTRSSNYFAQLAGTVDRAQSRTGKGRAE